MSPPPYVCPRCRLPLDGLECAACRRRYVGTDGIPCFLDVVPKGEISARDVYDEIYSHHSDVWEDQGRSADFRSYFAELTRPWAAGAPLLEVGCGEGQLLAALPGATRFGIDPSPVAVRRARERSGAECSVALAEALPFPDDAFAVVASVGVAEHFTEPDRATQEVRRVLRPEGRYVALIHVDVSRRVRIRHKISQFIWPRPRPLAFLRWLKKKLHHPIRQPLRRAYTIASAGDCLSRNGLRVDRIITLASEPRAPLAGAHVVIYVASKPA